MRRLEVFWRTTTLILTQGNDILRFDASHGSFLEHRRYDERENVTLFAPPSTVNVGFLP